MFVTWDEHLVASYETLDDATRATLRIKLGVFPRPMDVQSVGAFRLSEFALHSWDVRVGRDPKRPSTRPRLNCWWIAWRCRSASSPNRTPCPTRSRWRGEHRRSRPDLRAVDG